MTDKKKKTQPEIEQLHLDEDAEVRQMLETIPTIEPETDEEWLEAAKDLIRLLKLFYRPPETEPPQEERMTLSEFRKNLPDVLNRVSYQLHHVIITRHGRDLATVVPMKGLALLQTVEDAYDIISSALSEREMGDAIPFDEFLAELEEE